MNYAIGLLLDPRPSFFAHKDCVLAAMLAWIASPDDENLRKAAITDAAIQGLGDLEEMTWGAGKRSNYVIDMAARDEVAGRVFHEEIYRCIGGIRAISEFAGGPQLKGLFEEEHRGVRGVTLLMTILHALSLEDSASVLKASQRGVFRAVDALYRQKARQGGSYEHYGLDIIASKDVREAYRKRRKAAAFIYAAEQTRVGPVHVGKSLLLGKMSHIAAARTLKKFIATAKYIAETILVGRTFDDVRSFTLSVIPDTISSFAIGAPELSDSEKETIKAHFSVGILKGK